ncbi:hypothetical protein GCM10010435_06680 [Winogradskya consettensis]|uniref:PH domain-containing protein n=1 Tax=Winogradskya consettensis TaxID=113560 RepID=A0A919VU29_9ACTN|nr:hypothetical protein [Actinoplanes consettensis]GIM75882.1 hypothetical protein Aco04nite_47560 [Actinoplanes consettensis]
MGEISVVSPERPWKVGLAVVAGVSFLVLGSVLDVVTGVACFLLAWRLAATKVRVTPSLIEDVRLFRRVSWARDQVVDVVVGRPGGLWAGQCLVLVLADGTEAALLASRAYSRFPIGSHPQRLAAMAGQLRDALVTQPS